MRRGGHAPFRRAILVHHGQTGLYHVGGEGGVPEHLLGNLALGRNRAGFAEDHAGRFRGRVLLQPFDGLGHGIDGSRVICGTAARNAGADWTGILVHAHTPFVNRQAVRLAHIAHAGHRHPRVGVAPAKRRVLLAIVHVAIDLDRPAHVGHVAAREEFGDILVGRPVDRNAQVIAVLGLEVVLGLLIREPVVAEPVEVRELLVRQLIEIAVRSGGELEPDEIGQVQRGRGDSGTFAGHPLGQAAGLLIAPVGADQVRVVDIGVIDVFARLHLGLKFFNNVAFADQVMGDLDAGDRGKGRGQHLGFIFMRGDRFGHHLDFHAGKGLCRIDEPLHFRFLCRAVKRGQCADFGIKERLCGVHVCPGRRTHREQRKRHRG